MSQPAPPAAADPRLRAEEIARFLAAAGLGGAALAPLAGDASPRRYHRLGTAGEPRVLMDAPPQSAGSMAPFVAVTDWLRARGLSAPRIDAADLDAGLLLLEDLGDDLYAQLLARGAAEETALYAAAIDLLAHLAEAGDGSAPAGIAPYDMAALEQEARLVTDWYAPGAGRPPAAQETEAFLATLRAALSESAEARAVTVLRDYHAENLLWLPARPGHARVGLLDYQDALLGHPAYDLVSLLEDARRDTSDALQAAMLARYLDRAGLAGPEAEAFRAAYAALGAQRNLKIVGIFARLALRDGKPRYLALIPRVWGHLQRDLAHPALAPLAAAVSRLLPAPEPAVLARIAAGAGAAGAAGAARP
ncbi:MAG: phosphotransferase [Pseudomonadota bacterium]